MEDREHGHHILQSAVGPQWGGGRVHHCRRGDRQDIGAGAVAGEDGVKMFDRI